jgi:hypothetical protein
VRLHELASFLSNYWKSYQINLSFAAILHIENKRFFQASVRVCQGKESLVWSLCCLSIDGGEDELE